MGRFACMRWGQDADASGEETQARSSSLTAPGRLGLMERGKKAATKQNLQQATPKRWLYSCFSQPSMSKGEV